MKYNLKKDRFTIIKKVLNSDQINKLLNGEFKWKKILSKNRTLTKLWKGVFNEDFKYMNSVKLSDGRIDISLPKTLIEELNIKFNKKNYRIKNWNLLINPTNENVQEFHQDNGNLKDDEYYTLLIPLTDDEKMGKTEVIVPYSYNFPKKYEIIKPGVKIGDALLFSGCLWHRGTENLSKDVRYCLYGIITKGDLPVYEDWKL